MATRKTHSDTVSNQKALLDVLANNTYRQVILFASPNVGGSLLNDGPDINWPLMAALVETAQGELEVYDGVFLTAARYPRYQEVKSVLDAAETASNGNVMYATAPLPFTSSKSADDAASDMRSAKTDIFNKSTRAKFFKLLSRLTEEQYAKLVE